MPFKKGDPNINRTGLNKGSEWQSTAIRRAFERIAKNKKLSITEIRESLVAIGYNQASESNYPFWRDLMHYAYGKPKETIEQSITGEFRDLTDGELEARRSTVARRILEAGLGTGKKKK